MSADSSPLMVRGELDMTIVFPALRCDMVLVVASIGLECLLGTEALQSCLPHQLDLHTGQLWAGHYSCINNDRWFGRLPISGLVGYASG